MANIVQLSSRYRRHAQPETSLYDENLAIRTVARRTLAKQLNQDAGKALLVHNHAHKQVQNCVEPARDPFAWLHLHCSAFPSSLH